jgi:exonuclease III
LPDGRSLRRPESACLAKQLRPEMKIATLNVNDVKKRLANLLDWLRQARPDVACLQELKATDTEFPIAAIKKIGYGAIWRGQKSWNGVAILGRDCATLWQTRAPPYASANCDGDTAATSIGRRFESSDNDNYRRLWPYPYY